MACVGPGRAHSCARRRPFVIGFAVTGYLITQVALSVTGEGPRLCLRLPRATFLGAAETPCMRRRGREELQCVVAQPAHAGCNHVLRSADQLICTQSSPTQRERTEGQHKRGGADRRLGQLCGRQPSSWREAGAAGFERRTSTPGLRRCAGQWNPPQPACPARLLSSAGVAGSRQNSDLSVHTRLLSHGRPGGADGLQRTARNGPCQLCRRMPVTASCAWPRRMLCARR